MRNGFFKLFKKPLVWLLGLLACSCASSEGLAASSRAVQLAIYPVSSIQQIDQFEQDQALLKALSQVHLNLPKATTQPIPAPQNVALAGPLPPHQVFGFAPYWTLPEESQFLYADLTTLAYFSLDVNPDGTINESANDPGWIGYQSQDLVDLIDRAHEAQDRVVLTVSMFGDQAIGSFISNPLATPRLISEVIPLIAAKDMDGLNIDFEGVGTQIRSGLTRAIAAIATALHQANPAWQVTVDTYASSAADPAGPFDVTSLAPYVDGFFVMAYDMNDPQVPSPTSPLSGPSFSVAQAAASYANTVSPSKVILGLPFYGYDWPTGGGDPGAAASGPATPVTYAQIKASGLPAYWDPTTETPWTRYQVAGQWHLVFYDDPVSIALKAELAQQFHLAGVGAWALGMDGDDVAMYQALLGNGQAVKYLPPPPPSPPSTTTTTSTTTTLPPAPTTTRPGASSTTTSTEPSYSSPAPSFYCATTTTTAPGASTTSVSSPTSSTTSTTSAPSGSAPVSSLPPFVGCPGSG